MSDLTSKQGNLPSSWMPTHLGRVVNYGRTTKVEPSDIPDDAWVLELEDIERDSSRILQRMTFSQRQSKSTKNKFLAGDVLYGKLRPYLNKVVVADQPGYCTTEIVPIDAGHLDNRFLFYWLKHPTFLKYVEAESHGLNMPRLGTDTGNAAPFVLAPREEQTRIADQLDTLLARINACNDRLDTIPALLKRFRHAVLDAATSGALTLDWREQEQNITPAATNATGFSVEEMYVLPTGWRWERFGSFLSSFRSGTTVVPGNAQTAFPVLRSSSVRPMRIDFEDVRYFSGPSKARPEDLLAEGDLLFTRLSGSLEYVANCSVVRGLGSRRIYYPDRLFRAKLTRPEQGSYFELCFASPTLRKRLTVEAKSTAGHQRISMGAVTNFPIPLPSAEEQEEVVRRVNALFKLADGIEVRYSVCSLQAQRLIPLVLAKAFRGDLLPQDPSDEPASALLAQIDAQRESATPVPKIRQPRAPHAARTPKESATMTKSRQDVDD